MPIRAVLTLQQPDNVSRETCCMCTRSIPSHFWQMKTRKVCLFHTHFKDGATSVAMPTLASPPLRPKRDSEPGGAPKLATCCHLATR
ncbi:unnamed protein product [Protopolystoma xenopodis]|uniref:Uncharacterized protein n=1 Tax=Protopolystoma xenopodis TaxID=117903 RepID=A0A448XPG9_9PLAT|nr:unnamed protein product [Protopolystoma xenopodis]